jgi:hypothetical protein
MSFKNVLRIIAADKLKLAIALVGALTLATGAVTFGSWVVGSDPGAGYSKAKSSTNLTLNDVSASTVADLYPGGTGNVLVSITNPNPFAVTITSITGTGVITSNAGAPCTASTGVTFTNQTGLSLALAAGATTTFTLSGKAAMSNASVTSCQGAIFTIPVIVAATS